MPTTILRVFYRSWRCPREVRTPAPCRPKTGGTKFIANRQSLLQVVLHMINITTPRHLDLHPVDLIPLLE